MRLLIKNILFFFILATIVSGSFKKKTEYTIAFYNVENLFDTINDPLKMDEDYLSNGKYHWNSTRYYVKIKNLAKAIKELGNGTGPDLLGLCEVENKEVLMI